MLTILLLGTCDTKLPELLYTKQRLLSNTSKDTQVIVLDLGRTPSTHLDITIPHSQFVPSTIQDTSNLPKTEYISTIQHHATITVAQLHQERRIHGAIGIGGSSGTSLATGIMQKALPVGFPKMMVSTMTSGDISPYIEETDITMMYSVVDIAGRNRILERILDNAAAGVCGMAAAYESTPKDTAGEGSKGEEGKKRIGMTMFGVTTPCVDHVRTHLSTKYQDAYEIYIFHATGAGGKAMERLIRDHHLDAILDITTTEIADELIGGVLTAGPSRLSAGAEHGLPQVVSVGACDMVNFGTRGSVPRQFEGRKLYEHNPTVTLMRTTNEECMSIASFMGGKLRGCAQPKNVRVVLPTGGVSMVDVPGQAFHDPEADAALFDTLETELKGTGIEVRRDPRDINHPDFAVAIAEELLELMQH